MLYVRLFSDSNGKGVGKTLVFPWRKAGSQSEPLETCECSGGTFTYHVQTCHYQWVSKAEGSESLSTPTKNQNAQIKLSVLIFCNTLFPQTHLSGIKGKHTPGKSDVRVSYNDFYICLPSRGYGFDSRYPLQRKEVSLSQRPLFFEFNLIATGRQNLLFMVQINITVR